MSVALLFPGQGSQEVGMAELVERERPDLAALARELVGTDLFARMDEGTRFLQPAIFCASLALAAYATNGEPECAAGHSLGELSALVAAGAIAEEDGLRLVALRGRLMDEAGQRRPGGMLAVGDAAEAEQLAVCFGLAVANDNSPRQVALAGDDASVDAAVEDARARRVRATRLPVKGAFHSPAMEPAVEPFAAALANVEIRTPRFTVFSAATARPFDDVRLRLAEALTGPVRWRETVIAMDLAGAERFIDVGPGRVLAGLVRRILPGAEAVSIASAAAPGEPKLVATAAAT